MVQRSAEHAFPISTGTSLKEKGEPEIKSEKWDDGGGNPTDLLGNHSACFGETRGATPVDVFQVLGNGIENKE